MVSTFSSPIGPRIMAIQQAIDARNTKCSIQIHIMFVAFGFLPFSLRVECVKSGHKFYDTFISSECVFAESENKR